MKHLSFVFALVLMAGCGGGAASSPAPSASGAGEPAEPAEPVEPEGDPELCCCETPSVDPIHEMEPKEMCEGHGYCVDAEACSPTE